jgi:uncharacterized protein with FMN-binding domain
MSRDEPAAYWGMLGLSLALSILAVVTLLPNSAASKPNVLGYRSVCSFAPAATALCGLLAGISCTLRNRLVSKNAASARYRPFIVPGFVALLLLGVALASGISFGRAQARFGQVISRTGGGMPAGAAAALQDGSRSATVTEGDVSATAEVTVSSGRIHSMSLTGGQNVDSTLAQTIFEKVLAAGSADVDAVSGATASSNVLLKAVREALADTP